MKHLKGVTKDPAMVMKAAADKTCCCDSLFKTPEEKDAKKVVE